MQPKSLISILMLATWTVASLSALSADRGVVQPNNSASTALLEAASLQLEFGEVEQAGDTLERALRIEPNNPATLHYLGQVRFQEGQYVQAVALATRSNARARNDAELRNRNLQLIQAARQAMGPGVSTGAEAEVEVDELAEIRVGLDQEVDGQRAAGIAAIEPGGVQPYAAMVSAGQAGDWQAAGEGGLQATSLEAPPVYGEVRIPRGHMPPRGKCRIWFPDRPAGQQPAPGKCRKLQGRVPQGAYLVRG
ncbi:tetratricopeptide repeat protein [Pseudomonas sp. GCM10022186]|uniref:tetratricopeptide repeat protein n=1 Tax=Pseudomonas sp. GCM10022186 TaxID=3252650 RepID=UPI003608F2A6